LLKKQDLFLTVIPSKIFESMAMKKPIVLGVQGESCDIITEAGSGITIEPENAPELAAAVERLADNPDLCRQLGDSGATYVTEHFDRTVLATRYEGILAKVVVGVG
jgi:glycosyltransferase involved in cell wall biosynthesis